MQRFYPIGVPGQVWGAAEKAEWLAKQSVKRQYKDLVLSRIDDLRGRFDVVQYGALPVDPARYPLFAAKTKVWDAAKPSILVTGGVHGYETSGVMGALKFLHTEAARFEKHFNLVVCPCVSPWGFETVNRWNPNCHDPNRNFIPNAPAEECRMALDFLSTLEVKFLAHFDLHETTDSDESEFMPARAAHAGKQYEADIIPDGFYLVGPAEERREDFQKAMIDGVRKVTHIAPPDDKGNIISLPVEGAGIIYIEGRKMGLCAGSQSPKYATTTEVYPDSPKVDDDNCNDAQVACVVAGLEFIVVAEKL